MPSADRSTAPSGIGVSGPVVGGLGFDAGEGDGDDGEADAALADGGSRKSS